MQISSALFIHSSFIRRKLGSAKIVALFFANEMASSPMLLIGFMLLWCCPELNGKGVFKKKTFYQGVNYYIVFLRRSFVLPLWRNWRAGLSRFQKGASVPKGMSRNIQGLHDILSERQRYGCTKLLEGIDWTLFSCRNICPLLLGDGRGLLQRPWPQRAPHLHLQRGPLQLLRGGGG